jgi:hypothetical protein
MQHLIAAFRNPPPEVLIARGREGDFLGAPVLVCRVNKSSLSGRAFHAVIRGLVLLPRKTAKNPRTLGARRLS